VELAADYEGKSVVYKSKPRLPGDRVVIDAGHGTFVGTLAGKKALASDKTYYIRVRQGSDDGTLSDWSRWHQGFRVE
jgi:hypothetical protein